MANFPHNSDIDGIGINIDGTLQDATVTVEEFVALRREIGILHNGRNVDLTVRNSEFHMNGLYSPSDNVFGIKVAPDPSVSGSGTGDIVIGGGSAYSNSFEFLPGTAIYLDGNNSEGLQTIISHNTIGHQYAGGYSIAKRGILTERWKGSFTNGEYNSYISNNVIQNCGYSGIELRNSQDIKISENNVFDNYWGIRIADPDALISTYTQDILLERNDIHNNVTNGIYILTGSDNSSISGITIQENIVSNNGFHGINIDGSYGGEISSIYAQRENISTPTSYNKIEGNTYCGIYIKSGGDNNVHDIEVTGQEFSNNGIEQIRTSGNDVCRSFFFYNEFTTTTNPILLAIGSNHGLVAPVIENLEIYKDQNNQWQVPYSLHAGFNFADQDFIIQGYWREETATPGEYTYTFGFMTNLIEADASGIIEDTLYITANDGKELVLLASCLETGTYLGDTSMFSNVAQLINTAPRIVKVEVGNSTASDEIETAADASTQLVPVKLDGGVDRVTITFDRPIDDDDLTAVEGALSVDGRIAAWADWSDDLADRSVSFSADRKTITWTFTDGLHISGEMIITLSAAAIKTNGVALDGEWNSPTYWGDTVGNSTFVGGGHSGNGTAGGDFTFNFTLPNTRIGDANRDGIVDNLDAAILSAHWLRAGTWKDGDFNGNGIVNDTDATLLAINWLQTVWAAV